MNDVSILFEHVHLLDCLDGLYIELLEGCLQLLIVGARCFVDFLVLSSRGAFASAMISSSLAWSMEAHVARHGIISDV